jgi:histidinol-phosphate/aromatic aminotransferase/cobyric acid decarboxylase-like protein
MDSRRRPPVAHGGILDEELGALGVRPENVLDFSVNVNPYGPCPAIRRAIGGAAIDRYPHPTAAPARRALGERLGVDPDRVVVGNGAVDLLWILARSTLRPGDRAMTVEPTFSEMRSAALCAGAEIVEHRTDPQSDFAVDLGALDRHVREVQPRLLYICAPSNPAGVCVSLDGLSELAARHPQTLLVVDVSFLSVSARSADAEHATSPAILWVRSLTKDHALAGLRIGCAIASKELAERFEKHRPPWSVNALAQAAAVASTTDAATQFVTESRTRWLDDAARLAQALARLGLGVHPSETVYVLADLGEGGSATRLRHGLLARHGVLVRDATSFGLPRHIRVAARPARDLARLIDVLQLEIPR